MLKIRIFDLWTCGHDISAGARTKKNWATLEHYPGKCLRSNIAIIHNSIVERFEYPSTILPNLVMNSSALRGAQNLEIGKAQSFWPQNVCAVLPSHHPNFLIFGRVLSHVNFLEKKNRQELLWRTPYINHDIITSFRLHK
jgi:hypothetical protein